MAAGQPGWLSDSITWAVNPAAQDLGVWNTLFALAQVFIGFGLLCRPTVKPALAASFLWVFGRSPSLLLRGSAAFITAPRAGASAVDREAPGKASHRAPDVEQPAALVASPIAATIRVVCTDSGRESDECAASTGEWGDAMRERRRCRRRFGEITVGKPQQVGGNSRMINGRGCPRIDSDSARGGLSGAG